MATPQELRAPAGAIAELESFIASNPGHAAAHYRLGQLYQSVAAKQKALVNFEEAVRLKPADLNSRKMLADYQYVEAGDLESAITNYVRILELNPQDTENLTILGNIALSMNRFTEARKFFDTIARLEPWNSDVQKTLEAITRRLNNESRVFTYPEARTLAEGGKTAEAIQALELIVASEPAHTLAHNDLGVLYAAQGNGRLALEHSLAAVRSEPENLTARKNLADLWHAGFGDPEEAMKHYVEILRKQPDDVETLLAVASVCVALGKTDEARSFLSAVLTHQPGHVLAQEILNRLECVEDPPLVSDDPSGLYDDPKLERMLREKEKYAREYLSDVLRSEPGNRNARRGLDTLRTGSD